MQDLRSSSAWQGLSLIQMSPFPNRHDDLSCTHSRTQRIQSNSRQCPHPAEKPPTLLPSESARADGEESEALGFRQILVSEQLFSVQASLQVSPNKTKDSGLGEGEDIDTLEEPLRLDDSFPSASDGKRKGMVWGFGSLGFSRVVTTRENEAVMGAAVGLVFKRVRATRELAISWSLVRVVRSCVLS